jgi:hypothetical protein
MCCGRGVASACIISSACGKLRRAAQFRIANGCPALSLLAQPCAMQHKRSCFWCRCDEAKEAVGRFLPDLSTAESACLDLPAWSAFWTRLIQRSDALSGSDPQVGAFVRSLPTSAAAAGAANAEAADSELGEADERMPEVADLLREVVPQRRAWCMDSSQVSNRAQVPVSQASCSEGKGGRQIAGRHDWRKLSAIVFCVLPLLSLPPLVSLPHPPLWQ